ncbi:MAG: hypothetical protein Q8P44_05215 [Dehalococcoidia bacterium]|nr:hypothetical protein [Dehalococcoidia bacterium]
MERFFKKGFLDIPLFALILVAVIAGIAVAVNCTDNSQSYENESKMSMILDELGQIRSDLNETDNIKSKLDEIKSQMDEMARIRSDLLVALDNIEDKLGEIKSDLLLLNEIRSDLYNIEARLDEIKSDMDSRTWP